MGSSSNKKFDFQYDRGLGPEKASFNIQQTRKEVERPGSLHKILSVFHEFDVNICHVESKLHCFSFDGVGFDIDCVAAPNSPQVAKVIDKLISFTSSVNLLPPQQVPWFPSDM